MWQFATYGEDMLATKNKTRSKPSRLNIRISTDVKDRVARAASLLGQDLTEFTVSTLGERASEVIAKHEHIVLSDQEYQFFLELMERPARKPSKYAKKALTEYKKIINQDRKA